MLTHDRVPSPSPSEPVEVVAQSTKRKPIDNISQRPDIRCPRDLPSTQHRERHKNQADPHGRNLRFENGARKLVC
jgi:hypothetical protein